MNVTESSLRTLILDYCLIDIDAIVKKFPNFRNGQERLITNIIELSKKILSEFEDAVKKGVNNCVTQVYYNSPVGYKIEKVIRNLFKNAFKITITESENCKKVGIDKMRDRNLPYHLAYMRNAYESSDRFSEGTACLDLSWEPQQEKIIREYFTSNPTGISEEIVSNSPQIGTVHESDDPQCINSQYDTSSVNLIESNHNEIVRENEREGDGGFNTFRKENKYCDYTFTVDGKDFRVHKLVLAKNSKFFDSMFDSQIENEEPAKFWHETLKASQFEIFLEYIYTGAVDLEHNGATTLMELADLARTTEIKGLLELCQNKILQLITLGNFYEITKYALQFNEIRLIAGCKIFLNEHSPILIDALNLSEKSIAGLVKCYSTFRLLGSEEITQMALKEINSKICKDTFKSFCEETSKIIQENIKNKLKKICLKFATNNKELLQAESMKSTLDIYTRLMTGLNI